MTQNERQVPTNKLHLKNHFKLGIFSANCGGGLTASKSPARWQATWENNKTLALLADEAGIDFLLPVARWVGYGGATNFHGQVLETATWSAAVLAITRHITVLTTLHTVANNPVVAAKQIATLDQIGGGRAGLNIVAGWNKPEYEALGLNLPDDHQTRYGLAQEWFDVVKKLWTSTERFDFDGKYYKLKGVHSDPKPVSGIPPIINAAGSVQGREFAVRNADLLFMIARDIEGSGEEIAALIAQAKSVDRNAGVMTHSFIACRPTEKEAQNYVESFSGENIDWVAVDRLVELQIKHAQSIPKEVLTGIRQRMALTHGGLPLIGSPEQIADDFCKMHEVGFAGSTISFFDYNKEFPYFRDTVLPILEARGIRLPRSSAKAAPPLVNAVGKF